jgi:hypothetical protein
LCHIYRSRYCYPKNAYISTSNQLFYLHPHRLIQQEARRAKEEKAKALLERQQAKAAELSEKMKGKAESAADELDRQRQVQGRVAGLDAWCCKVCFVEE